MKPLQLTRNWTSVRVPLVHGLVTRYESEQVLPGQFRRLVNFVWESGRLVRRPAVHAIDGFSALDRVYWTHFWQTEDGDFILAVAPNNVPPAQADGLALIARDAEYLFDASSLSRPAATLDDAFFSDPALRSIAAAELRKILLVSDGVDEVKAIEKVKSTAAALTGWKGGAAGYHRPHTAPRLVGYEFAANPNETALEHGIYQLATAYIYEDGQPSNPGPRSNILESQWAWHTEGLAAILLENVPAGDELDARSAERVVARQFPGRYKEYADELFGDVVERDEKAGLAGTSHSSTATFDGAPAVTDNDEPPAPRILLAGRDSLFALGGSGPHYPAPFDLFAAAYPRIQCSRVALVTVTNPNPRTDTRVPISVTVQFSDLEGYTDERSGEDLVWTDDDGISILPYRMTNYVPGTSATFEIQVPELPAGGAVSLYLYYQDPSSDTNYSLLDATWSEIWKPELLKQTHLARWPMLDATWNGAANQDGPHNQLGESHGKFHGSATFAGALSAPPYNQVSVQANSHSDEPFVSFSASDGRIDFGDGDIQATPQALTARLRFRLRAALPAAGEGVTLLANTPEAVQDGSLYRQNRLLYRYAAGAHEFAWLTDHFNGSSWTYAAKTEITLTDGMYVGQDEWVQVDVALKKTATGWGVRISFVNMESGQGGTTYVEQDGTAVVLDGTTGDSIAAFAVQSTNIWRVGRNANDATAWSAGFVGDVAGLELLNYDAAYAETQFAAKRAPHLPQSLTAAVRVLDRVGTGRQDNGGRMQVSKTGLAHAWPMDSAHVLVDETDGQPFLAAAMVAGGVLAFKDSKMTLYRLDALREAWTRVDSIDPQSHTLGIAGPDAIAPGRLGHPSGDVDAVFFLGSDRKLYAWVGGQIRNVGDPTDDTLESLTPAQLERVHFAFDDPNRRLIASYPSSATGGAANALDDAPGITPDIVLVMSVDHWDESRPRWTTLARSADSKFPCGPSCRIVTPQDGDHLVWAGSAWGDGALYAFRGGQAQDDWSVADDIHVVAEVHPLLFEEPATIRSLEVMYRVLGQSVRAAQLTAKLRVRDPLTLSLVDSTQFVALPARRQRALPVGITGDAFGLLLSSSAAPEGLSLDSFSISVRNVGRRRDA